MTIVMPHRPALPMAGPGPVIAAGRGLALMPSAYTLPAVAAITDEPWQPAIVYPARGITGLWQQAPPPPGALVRLLGRTRALLLVSLGQPASTSTLAALHGLSPSGTSGHLTAMRDARLITGTRHGHEIRYTCTRLGTELTHAAARREAEVAPLGSGQAQRPLMVFGHQPMTSSRPLRRLGSGRQPREAGRHSFGQRPCEPADLASWPSW